MTIREFKKLIKDCNDDADIDICIRNDLTLNDMAMIDVDDCGGEVVFNVCKYRESKPYRHRLK